MAYRIVIAEDEFILASNLKALVESLHHEVVAIAETGTEAIAHAAEYKPDLILMDIQMSELDGISAARVIARDHQIPIVIISAFHDRGYIEEAADAGVMTYLTKPVSVNDLQAVISLTLARHRELHTLRQEVGDLKTALEQRKAIERAKGVLMDRWHLTEAEAFKRLQQLSQQENRRMIDIAEAILTTNLLWSDKDSTPA